MAGLRLLNVSSAQLGERDPDHSGFQQRSGCAAADPRAGRTSLLPSWVRANCDTRSVPLIKDPHPDPRVDPFRRGVATLSRDGVLHGHLFSTVEWLWSPSSPLRKQWCVRYTVAWSDGTRDDPQEDYQPWDGRATR